MIVLTPLLCCHPRQIFPAHWIPKQLGPAKATHTCLTALIICRLVQACQASPAAAWPDLDLDLAMDLALVTKICSCRPAKQAVQYPATACADRFALLLQGNFTPSSSCPNSSCSLCPRSAYAPAGFFRPVKQAPRPATAFEADKLRPAPVAGIAKRPEPIRQRPKDVVVAWWHDNIADLLHSLDMFSPKGTTVRVISEEKPKVSLRRSGV